MALQNAKSLKQRNLLGSPQARKVALTRQPLNAQVAERLRTMIVNGEMEVGKKIPFTEIAEKLGVSLTPLREAIKVLAEEQLVELTPNRGARVLPVSVEETVALFEVIAELEALAAKLAAERMTGDERADLEAMHAEMREYYETGNREAYFEMNSRIHAAIVAYSHNPVLLHTHQKMTVRVARVRFIAVHQNQRWKQAMQEHEDVMQAFRDHDGNKAADIWRKHLQESGRVTIEILEAKEQQEQEAGAVTG